MTEIPPEALALITNQIQEITKSMSIDDSYTTLIETDILLKTIDEPFKKNHKLNKLQNKINHLLLNPQNNRLLRLNSTIKREIETNIEYLDKDIGMDERLYYQEELENDLIKINQEIRNFLAIIIKHKLKEDFEI